MDASQRIELCFSAYEDDEITIPSTRYKFGYLNLAV